MGPVSVFLLSPLPQFPPRSRGRRVLLNALIVKTQSIPAAWRQTQEGCDVRPGIRGLLIKLNSPPGPGEGGQRGAETAAKNRWTSGEANAVSEKEERYLAKENN